MDGKNLDSERKRRLFSEDDLQILISTYEANPAPDRRKLRFIIKFWIDWTEACPSWQSCYQLRMPQY